MLRLSAALLGRSLLCSGASAAGGGGALRSWLDAVVAHHVLKRVLAEAEAATDGWLERKQSGDDARFEQEWWNQGRVNWREAVETKAEGHT